jgi:L-ascorbate metabolism protein UlaG (beta-lactamase superfamily)
VTLPRAILRIGGIRAGFVGHATFLFGAADGTVLLTDPYFCGAFEWQGRTERHLQQPDVQPDSIHKFSLLLVLL